MGIKAIHLCLIGLSLLLCLGFGVWSLGNGFTAMGWGSLVCAAAVLVYGINFLRKFKAL